MILCLIIIHAIIFLLHRIKKIFLFNIRHFKQKLFQASIFIFFHKRHTILLCSNKIPLLFYY